jgi:hypothetical protein
LTDFHIYESQFPDHEHIYASMTKLIQLGNVAALHASQGERFTSWLASK